MITMGDWLAAQAELAREKADLDAYNARALVIADRCQRERAAVRSERTKDYYDLASQRAAGVQMTWATIEAVLSAAHARGQRGTVELLRTTAEDERTKAEDYYQTYLIDSRPDEPMLTERTASVRAYCDGRIAAATTCLAIFDDGTLSL